MTVCCWVGAHRGKGLGFAALGAGVNAHPHSLAPACLPAPQMWFPYQSGDADMRFRFILQLTPPAEEAAVPQQARQQWQPGQQRSGAAAEA